MKKLALRLSPFASLVMPFVAAAASSDLNTFLNTGVKGILQAIVNFLVVLATFILIWGIFKYITAAGDEEKVKEGRNFIIYGVIGVALMLTIRGLVSLVTNTISGTGIDTNATLSAPTL